MAAVARLTIHYPDGTDGDLVFSKAVLTPETPDEVLLFAAKAKKFPRDSTADQFLEPEQVTQYVALGRAVGRRAGALARDVLGYTPAVTLEDGLVELSEWLRDQAADDRVAEASRELASRGLTV